MARRISLGSRTTRCALRLAAGLLLTFAGLLGCRQKGQVPDSCRPCSSGFQRNAKAHAELEALWHTIAPEVWKQGELDLSCVCFGSGASTSVEGQNIELSVEWEPRERAARAAHLALHRKLPPWTPRSPDACDARVERALEREVEAHLLELDTRRALGVTSQRYPFEPEYWKLPAPQRAAWLLSYFRANPEGDGIVPGFASQYRARCGALPG